MKKTIVDFLLFCYGAVATVLVFGTLFLVLQYEIMGMNGPLITGFFDGIRKVFLSFFRMLSRSQYGSGCRA